MRPRGESKAERMPPAVHHPRHGWRNVRYVPRRMPGATMEAGSWFRMSDTRVTGWVGWAAFAAIMLILGGGFDILYGFIALALPDSAYLTAPAGALFVF